MCFWEVVTEIINIMQMNFVTPKGQTTKRFFCCRERNAQAAGLSSAGALSQRSLQGYYCLPMTVEMTFRPVPGWICSAWDHTLMATGITHMRTFPPRALSFIWQLLFITFLLDNFYLEKKKKHNLSVRVTNKKRLIYHCFQDHSCKFPLGWVLQIRRVYMTALLEASCSLLGWRQVRVSCVS